MQILQFCWWANAHPEATDTVMTRLQALSYQCCKWIHVWHKRGKQKSRFLWERKSGTASQGSEGTMWKLRGRHEMWHVPEGTCALHGLSPVVPGGPLAALRRWHCWSAVCCDAWEVVDDTHGMWQMRSLGRWLQNQVPGAKGQRPLWELKRRSQNLGSFPGVKKETTGP